MQSQTMTHWRARKPQGLLALAFGLACAAAQAATITVTTVQDGTTGCTLRGALQNVNAQGQPNTNCAAATGSDVISLPAGTYALQSGFGPLTVTRSVTIEGAGAGSTAVLGGSVAKAGVRVFDVLGSGITVTLRNLEVRNGNARPDSQMSSAGGLYVAAGATVTVDGVLFQDNWADSSGGAIENRGTLTVQGATFTGNQARGEGGAIRNIGVLQVLASRFDNNKAERGGAIWLSTATGTVPINNSSFNGNQATGVGGGTVFYGGALMNADESGATLVLTNNSYSSNAAGGAGDVVWEGNPRVVLTGTPQPIMAGTALALSATVQGSYVMPTGQVTLRSGTTALASCTGLALAATNPATTPPSGEVQCATSSLSRGLHSLTASYAGDSNHGTGVSPAVAQIVNGYTNTDNTTITISGPEGATVWVGGTQRGTLGETGVMNLSLATPAPDGSKTFLLETRVNGTVLNSGTLTLIRDTEAPAWSGLEPANAGYLRSASTLDYTLSENAATATITLTRTNGSPDPATHTCTLQGAALLAGAHQVGLGAALDGCVTALNLIEGATYTLNFVAMDAAGNVSASTATTGITYDAQPPLFSGLVPAAGSAIKADSLLGYTLSEAVARASIVATRTSGAMDGVVHTCGLQGTALTAGPHQVSLGAGPNGCTQALALVDGATYTLAFAATDPAGNTAAPTQVMAITYDATSPTATLVLPPYSTSRTVNVTLSGNDGGGAGIAEYCLQASNAPGTCAWTSVAPTSITFGADGPQTLYGFVRDRAGNVSAAESASVTVDTAPPTPPTLTTTPAWVTGNSITVEVNGEPGARVWVDGANTGVVLDGAGKAHLTLDTSGMAEGSNRVFQIILRDAAGNASALLDLHLDRDGLPPEFSALAPLTGGALKADSTVGYTLSEDVVSATITFAHSNGSPDAGAPHICTLQGAALQAGARTVPLAADANGCAASLALVDGAIYTLQFAATDTAGNGSAPTQVLDILYDITPPASPQVSSPVNGATGEGANMTVVGTAEAGTRVEVREGAALLAHGMATGGSFSIPVQGLTYGHHSLELTATDAAGNVSAVQPLAYTATVATTLPTEPPNPPAVTGGTVTVPPGNGVTVNGPVRVTAGPGSTVTLLPGAGGTTIVLPAVGGPPVSVVIGGQTFSVQPQEGVLTLSVVTLVGADGNRQVALVLNPSPDGASRVALGGTVSTGTVVGLLRTDGGDLPLTAVGSGPVSVVLEAGSGADGASSAPRWRILVAQGQVALSGVPGVDPLALLGGEVARLDGAGHLLSARLGAANGEGLGDPVKRTDLPAGVLGQFGYVHLNGVPTRWGGSQTVEQRAATVLQGMGISMAPVAPDGSVHWTIGTAPVSVVPLEIQVAPGRSEGAAVAADGSIEVVSGGLVIRFGPALHDLAGLVRELGAAGGTTEMAVNGGLRVTLGGSAFQVRPAWWPLGSLGQPPGFSVLPSVGLVFTATDGVSHSLIADVADRATLNGVLSQAFGQPVTVQTDLNMVTSVELDQQRFELIPDAMLLPASTGPSAASWWLEGSKLFVRYPGGMVQGFEVLVR